MFDLAELEKKWQLRWFNKKISEVKKDTKKKFFIHFAYPGISGYLHVGHLRGFTYADIIARYKRMNGFNVCFPAGFHASGLPAVSLAKKIERGDKKTIQYLKDNGCPEDTISILKKPENVVKYFSQIYVEEYWKKFGFFIDYSRLMTTISPGYKKFIEWQFRKLYENKFLIKKPHFAPFCPNCGPVAVDKSETDISQGGNAEVLEFTIIKFTMDSNNLILPAATLRPETVFGVTNMWINPNIEYQVIKINDEKWVVSKEAAIKIKAQQENVEILKETIDGTELVGKECLIPVINKTIPILAAEFTDPAIATGIVMSVPAHAPYDWIALQDSKKTIDPVVIIDLEGYQIPARDICKKMDIKSQDDTKKLDEATEEVYKQEFHKGILNEKCGEYAGIRVSDIKDKVKNNLIENKKGAIIMEFSEKVKCRCGEKIIIKRVPDQWFIRYSDNDLTRISQDHSSTMSIFPPEYKEELHKVLDWFDDRACIRQGSWLGTEFPYKKNWIIEPISDSTLYPAYYIISKFVNEGKIKQEELTTEFFDFVFLGKGTPKEPLWTQVKNDFDYWYPVDINLGGKEHKTVHFPVFIMNHIALFNKEKWPQGIFVNWWITQTAGEKISKSKGGAEPIPGAAQRYGVDSMRLYYAHVGSPHVDIEWDANILKQYKKRILRVWKFILELNEITGTENSIDEWINVAINEQIKKIRDSLDKFHLREAANQIFFEIYKILQWYVRRGGNNHTLLNKIITTWLKTMTPFTPHISEELWEKIGNSGFISNDVFPEYNSDLEKDIILRKEELLINIIDDISEIIEVTNIKPQKIYIFTSPKWKWDMVTTALKLKKDNQCNIASLMKKIMENEKIKKHSKEASSYAKKLVPHLQHPKNIEKYLYKFDENKYLKENLEFLHTFFEIPQIKIYDAEDNSSPDPGKKKTIAEPLRPAIYLE